MGKMLKKCCMLALAGGMVFGGGCLNFGGAWKFAGRGLAEGAGWSLGSGATNEFVTAPLTNAAAGANAFAREDALFHARDGHPNPHEDNDDGN